MKLDVEKYWNDPPPELTERCVYWVQRIVLCNFKPNRRIRAFGYYEAAEWFRVYIWEWRHVIRPILYNEPVPDTSSFLKLLGTITGRMSFKDHPVPNINTER